MESMFRSATGGTAMDPNHFKGIKGFAIGSAVTHVWHCGLFARQMPCCCYRQYAAKRPQSCFGAAED